WERRRIVGIADTRAATAELQMLAKEGPPRAASLFPLPVPDVELGQAGEHELAPVDVGRDLTVPRPDHDGDRERVASAPDRDLRYQRRDSARLVLRRPLGDPRADEAGRRQLDSCRRTCSAAIAARTASGALVIDGTFRIARESRSASVTRPWSTRSLTIRG